LPTFKADVAVLGGGPGGSSAAIECARAGLRVVVVERERFPREHVGETLHPGVEPLLVQLGVWEEVRRANFLRHAGNWIEWAGERRFAAFGADDAGAWHGLQAWRADFDAILLERARSLGVHVLQPCQAVRPLLAGQRVVGLETASGEFLRAPFVVDAAGDRHWLARHLRLPITKHSRRLTARYGYVEGVCAARDDAPEIVSDARGWTWTARVRPQLYQWTRLSVAGEEDDDGAAARVEREECLPVEFRGLKPRGAAKGADVTWRIVERAAGAGYFLVGDAAAVLDPASSHGVLKAIMAGMMAAHSAAHVFARRLTEREAAERYCNWIKDWFEHDVARLTELYSIFEPPSGCARPAASAAEE
jgi:flavin-dependent dehydrogenase